MKQLKVFLELIKILWMDKVDVIMLTLWFAAGIFLICFKTEALSLAETILSMNEDINSHQYYKRCCHRHYPG